MKRTTIAFILAAIIVSLYATAQRKKTVTKKKVAATEQKAPENPKIAQMLSATQRIIFIDSIVVNKQDFLKHIRLNPETGTLSKSSDFFGKKGDATGTVYENELGNKCYFSHNGQLYTSDLLKDEWSKPATLDAESGKFLRPENIGMPFNSEANDYMYAVDELDSIGYFVTDRRQAEGKVCVYTFIPNQSRRSYDPDNYDDATLRSLARIDHIKDTWGNGQQRKQALARVKRLSTARNKKKADEIVFHVNDDITYTSLAEFLLPDNRDQYLSLQEKKKRMDMMKSLLEKQRQEYAMASAAERDLMEGEILRNENEYYELELVIRQTEKNIRNSELKLLK